MQGRNSDEGLLVVMANAKNPDDEASMNEWYNHTHLPDLTMSGIFRDATRYMNPAARGDQTDPRFIAIYETDRQDVARARAENLSGRDKWRDDGSGGAPIIPTMMAGYVRIGAGSPNLSGKKTAGILVSMNDCEPANDAAYNNWYDVVHVPEVLGTELYWSAVRYKNADPSDGNPLYLAVYETEMDAAQARDELAARGLNRGPGHGARRFANWFNLIFAQAKG